MLLFHGDIGYANAPQSSVYTYLASPVLAYVGANANIISYPCTYLSLTFISKDNVMQVSQYCLQY